MMTEEQALAILNQVIGELPFKVVQSFNLIQVYSTLHSAAQQRVKLAEVKKAE